MHDYLSFEWVVKKLEVAICLPGCFFDCELVDAAKEIGVKLSYPQSIGVGADIIEYHIQ